MKDNIYKYLILFIIVWVLSIGSNHAQFILFGQKSDFYCEQRHLQ